MNHKIVCFEKLDVINDYEKVIIINIDIDKYDTNSDEITNKIIKYNNVKELILTTNCEDLSVITEIFFNFNNKIALLQNLSEIEINFRDSTMSLLEFMVIPNTQFIYDNYLTIFGFSLVNDIPINIKHINILNIHNNNVNLLNNLPKNIENIHFSCVQYGCLNQITNLQPTLKHMNITIVTNDENLKINDSIIKLPFGCKLQIDYIVY